MERYSLSAPFYVSVLAHSRGRSSPNVGLGFFQNSYVTWFVHVREQPGYGDVSDGLLEEDLLDGGRADRPEGGQQQ